MFIHFHSLYLGIGVYALLLWLGVPVFVGLLGVVACLGADYQSLKVRIKKSQHAKTYAAASLLQASVLFLLYALLYAVIHGKTFLM